MPTFLVLLLNVFVGGLANVFLKIGADRLPSLNFGSSLKFFSDPFILLGILLFTINFPLYGLALQRMKLGVAFPLVTSLTFVLVIVISAFYLKESFTLWQLFGVALLGIGLWLLAK